MLRFRTVCSYDEDVAELSIKRTGNAPSGSGSQFSQLLGALHRTTVGVIQHRANNFQFLDRTVNGDGFSGAQRSIFRNRIRMISH